MNWFTDEFSEQIFNTKYRGDGQDIRSYFSGLAKLVAMGDTKLEREFFRMMWEKRFSPGGRILAYAGRPGAKLSMMNCTTHEITDDSLEAISDTAYLIMRASSRGQGIGISLSNLRPDGSPVNNAAKTSTGAISFMEMLSAVGGTIGQEGRRAAMLFSLKDSHPDLYRPQESTVVCPSCQGEGCGACNNGMLPYDFLHVKKVPGKVENANISVMVTDAFMNAVQQDAMWHLHFRGSTGSEDFRTDRFVPARELFMALARSAKASAEPGILYWDTAQRMSNSDQFGERWRIVGTNACSEEPLDQDGVCNLGSLNLASYVVNPFTKDSWFDHEAFRFDIGLAVEFLDNVVELEIRNGNYISSKQLEALMYLRRLGLGVMGLADMLAMMGLSYDSSDKTLARIHRIFSLLQTEAYRASTRLARQKGPAKAWSTAEESHSSIILSGFYSTLPGAVVADILRYGVRNATVLSIAPTGTISNLYGVSSGIEPIFARSYFRMTRMGGTDEHIEYVHPGVRQASAAGLHPSVYQTAYEVSPDDHLLIQSTVQAYIDASIAKTVNMPSGTTDKQVADAYTKAWKLGLKGLAIYVDGSRTQQVLYTQFSSDACPECGGTVVKEEGCTHCSSCEWGKCSI